MLDGLKAMLDYGLRLPVAFPESLQVLLIAPQLGHRLLQLDLPLDLNSVLVCHVGYPTVHQPIETIVLSAIGSKRAFGGDPVMPWPTSIPAEAGTTSQPAVTGNAGTSTGHPSSTTGSLGHASTAMSQDQARACTGILDGTSYPRACPTRSGQ